MFFVIFHILTTFVSPLPRLPPRPEPSPSTLNHRCRVHSLRTTEVCMNCAAFKVSCNFRLLRYSVAVCSRSLVQCIYASGLCFSSGCTLLEIFHTPPRCSSSVFSCRNYCRIRIFLSSIRCQRIFLKIAGRFCTIRFSPSMDRVGLTYSSIFHRVFV